VDELRDRAALRARQRRHPHRRPLLGDASRRRSRSGSSSATCSASRSGIIGASWLGSRCAGIALALSWPVIAGRRRRRDRFTVSLLISSIAFDGAELEEAKLGVLAAAVVATV
jgi:phosphoglycerate dehydrogenase-like enzyme